MGWLLAAVGALVVALVIGVAVYEEVLWSRFKAEYNCRVVGHMTGDVFPVVTFGGNGAGVGVGSTPAKTGWQCDDGKTYWR